jgi:hypothetical protein
MRNAHSGHRRCRQAAPSNLDILLREQTDAWRRPFEAIESKAAGTRGAELLVGAVAGLGGSVAHFASMVSGPGLTCTDA